MSSAYDPAYKGALGRHTCPSPMEMQQRDVLSTMRKTSLLGLRAWRSKWPECTGHPALEQDVVNRIHRRDESSRDVEEIMAHVRGRSAFRAPQGRVRVQVGWV